MRSNGRSADHVSVYINARLNGLAPARPERCILKVHHQLHSVNENSYEPEMVAFGPYHRGKNRLQLMEEHKLRYLKQRLEQRSDSGIVKYVISLRGLEERARNCFAEPVRLSVDELEEMMLLEGCFIIEPFHKYEMGKPRDFCDPLFILDWIHTCLLRNTMLFENQLQFFVLSQLFNMSWDREMHYNLPDIALHFYGYPLPNPASGKIFRENPTKEIKHLCLHIH